MNKLSFPVKAALVFLAFVSLSFGFMAEDPEFRLVMLGVAVGIASSRLIIYVGELGERR